MYRFFLWETRGQVQGDLPMPLKSDFIYTYIFYLWNILQNILLVMHLCKHKGIRDHSLVHKDGYWPFNKTTEVNLMWNSCEFNVKFHFSLSFLWKRKWSHHKLNWINTLIFYMHEHVTYVHNCLSFWKGHLCFPYIFDVRSHY